MLSCKTEPGYLPSPAVTRVKQDIVPAALGRCLCLQVQGIFWHSYCYSIAVII